MENYFTIGKIVNTQGVKGEVRVIPMTDDPKRYKALKEVFVYPPRKENGEQLQIESVRYHKQFVLLKFKGIDDMTTAERLKESILKIPDSWALPLAEDEFYIRDLYDMDVVAEDGTHIGVLEDIIFTAANDVYVVKEDNGNELLLPAIKSCILKVDTAQNTMIVHVLEGLRE